MVPVELPAEGQTVGAVAACGVEVFVDSGCTVERPATAVTSFASAWGSDAATLKWMCSEPSLRRIVSTGALKARAIVDEVPVTRKMLWPLLSAPTLRPELTR